MRYALSGERRRVEGDSFRRTSRSKNAAHTLAKIEQDIVIAPKEIQPSLLTLLLFQKERSKRVYFIDDHT